MKGVYIDIKTAIMNFKKLCLLLLSCLLLAMYSCSDEDSLGLDSANADIAGSIGLSETSGNGAETTEGLITAGEWNDLEEWDFWKAILQREEFEPNDRWVISTSNRLSVVVLTGTTPMVDVEVEVRQAGLSGFTRGWKARTDNSGKAELWIDPFSNAATPNLSDFVYVVDGTEFGQVLNYESGVVTLTAPLSSSTSSLKVDLSFIVDATSSMADELEFIKDDLEDVIRRVESNNRALEIRTSTVFYRDEGDEYLVRGSEFTEDLDETLAFIDRQSAGGGGDFPEAVHTGLERSISNMRWSEEARTRIAFLILDAPPHDDLSVISSISLQIRKAAEKGIKLIPITASGIDKNTELLMRQMAILTNGTYVFITNDSGIGNDHLEASVGDYEVEFLNDLMVRLIGEYSE